MPLTQAYVPVIPEGSEAAAVWGAEGLTPSPSLLRPFHAADFVSAIYHRNILSLFVTLSMVFASFPQGAAGGGWTVKNLGETPFYLVDIMGAAV